MARFGLASDSEEEEDQQSTVSSESDLIIEDEDTDTAPPVTTLSDQDDSQNSDDDDDDEEGTQAGQSLIQRDTRSPSMSHRSGSLFMSRTATPAKRQTPSSPSTSSSEDDSPPVTRSRRLPPPTSAATGPRAGSRGPWAKTLKLEPKKVALMQASFFGQQELERDSKEREKELERERKRREADAKTKLTVPSKPTPSAPAPSATVSVPVPSIYRPFRTPFLVPFSSSTPHDSSSTLTDAGLMFSRSFRVGHGPTGKLVHSGKGVYGKRDGDGLKVKVEQLQVVEDPSSSTSQALSLLAIHLDNTPVYLSPPTTSSSLSATSIPYAVPHPELRFSNFLSLFPSTSLFHLAHALFDEIDDLELPPDDGSISSETYHHILALRRKDNFSKWLSGAVKSYVEEDLQSLALKKGGSVSTAAERVFLLLSGNQVERATETAIESGDLRLATLLAQIGGDDDFKNDIYLQLEKWREYGVDAFVDEAYRRVYEVLGGNVGLSVGPSESKLLVLDGLDWKRAFGMTLWYGGEMDGDMASAVEEYEKATQIEDWKVAPPLPKYLESPDATANDATSTKTTWTSTTPKPIDPIFALLKVFVDPTQSLEDALLPRNFTSSPIDYCLPWHLYILFSRVLRKRDFEDRVEVGVMDDGEREGLEGNSPVADMVTESYAMQLEQAGEWTWACFVLLHLEMPERRAKVIQETLDRNVDKLSTESFAFLVDKLKIPASWIYASQATVEQYRGDYWAQFNLLVEAELLHKAHAVAALHLLPEAVIKNDMVLLRKIVEPLVGHSIQGWETGGQLFLDYADCSDSLHRNETGSSFDSKLLALIKGVPSLLERDRSSRKLKMAVSEMQSRLTVIASTLDKHTASLRPSHLLEADRLTWLQGINSSFLANSLKQACTA